ncbi:hypothetical protein [Rossellomorea sp. FM04394]|uniref:hypothetical protein n=1 Tax=Rossellomorea sp. FM04394 TaxID=3243076 RepID=UPI0035A5C5A9
MSIKNLQVISKRGYQPLPDWINFGFEIGAYLSENALKRKEPLNIILSIPYDDFFSLFIAVGIADKTFSKNKQLRSIRKTILNLIPGSRIIYKDDISSRKASVISIEESPVFENEMILKIKDGKIERGIPEKQWIDRVIILDEEFDEIKRTRKVSENQNIGLNNNEFLKKLYTSRQLYKVGFYPGDKFYIVGNNNNLFSLMNEKVFFYEKVIGRISDFLYLDNKNSFTNGKLISSQLKKNEHEIMEEVPVIYSNLNSYMKQVKNFNKNPKIIVASRTDNESRLHEVKEDIKRELLDGKKIVTTELIEYLEQTEVNIPAGIEVLAWR